MIDALVFVVSSVYSKVNFLPLVEFVSVQFAFYYPPLRM